MWENDKETCNMKLGTAANLEPISKIVWPHPQKILLILDIITIIVLHQQINQCAFHLLWLCTWGEGG